MKTFAKVLALILLGPTFDVVADCIKKQLVKPYLSLLHHLRALFFICFCTFLGIVIILASFVLFHVALYLYIPWNTEEKALLLLSLSVSYLIISLVVVWRLSSKTHWIKITETNHLVRAPSNTED